MKRRIVFLLWFFAVVGAAQPARGAGRLVDLQIVDQSTGTVLPVYYSFGSYWVAGSPGRRYSVSIRNTLGERLLAVASVDGINVISGATAAVGQTGYVLGPFQSYDIMGWRKTDTEVAAFEFAAAPDSYAQRTGRPANLGVVGVAVFRERPALVAGPRPFANPSARAGDAPRPTSSDAPARESRAVPASPATDGSFAPRLEETPRLGTGHGERETSVVSHTDFERATERPDEILTIRYDRYDRLVAMGVIRRPPMRAPQPEAFPGSSLLGYVPDPPR